jgi:hypothetical protein
MRLLSRTSIVVSAALLIPRSVSADVLVVAHAGAPYTTVQSAIDAAHDGDTVLVRIGSYSESPVIDGKSISLCGDPEANVLINNTNPIQVTNLAAGQCVLLSGFYFAQVYDGGVRASNNAGSLRLVGLRTVTNTAPWNDAVHVSNCQDVDIARCTLIGADSVMMGAAHPGIGLDIDASRVAVHDSTIRGGRGANAFPQGMGGYFIDATPGASGCRVGTGCQVFFSGGTVQGGAGGQGIPALCYPGSVPGGPGASGGAGLEIANPLSSAWILATATIGGAGGPGGTPAVYCGMPGGAQGPNGADIAGNATAINGTARVLSAPSLVRELHTLDLSASGQPGDQVWAAISLQPGWTLDLPFHGVRLCAPPLRRVFLGTVSGTGTLNYALVMPALPPNVESRRLHLQAFFVDALGATWLGSGSVAVELQTGF